MTKNVILTLVLTLSFMFYSANVSAAKPSAKKWTEQCDDETKVCLALIQKITEDKETIAVMYMRKGLVQVGEKKIEAPILLVNLPLNQDLRVTPKIIIDDDQANGSLNINFSNCNAKNGCVANAALNDKAIELLKEGKKVSIVFKLFDGKENLKMDFPLKGFTKAYSKIFEK